MKRFLPLPLVSAILLALPVSTLAQDEPAVEVIEEQNELTEILDEIQEARDAYFKAARAAESDEEREKLVYPAPETYAERVRAVAKKHAGTEIGAEALTWMVQNLSEGDRDWALGAMLADHMDSEKLAGVCSSLQRDLTGKTEAALRKIFKESPHTNVRGQALYAVAMQFKNGASAGARLADPLADARMVEYYEEMLDAPRLAVLKNEGARDEMMTEFLKLMKTVEKDFSEVDLGRGRMLGEVAAGELFEAENLQIGKIAPDIEAEDIEGVSFKLSDYRGKVVVLDFWGDW